MMKKIPMRIRSITMMILVMMMKIIYDEDDGKSDYNVSIEDGDILFSFVKIYYVYNDDDAENVNVQEDEVDLVTIKIFVMHDT